jgi:hypothetical protein
LHLARSHHNSYTSGGQLISGVGGAGIGGAGGGASSTGGIGNAVTGGAGGAGVGGAGGLDQVSKALPYGFVPATARA